MKEPTYSIIIPVFNRPQELEELLVSLTQQTFKNFEVIVVEDGSSVRSDQVVDQYRDQLTIHYFFKPNSGPGPSRNFGYGHAHGEYLIVFDSDCIIPSGYLEIVDRHLKNQPLDAWGGPDRAHQQFTDVQQAMGYTMASVLTTGGIRGSKKRVGWFQPRSFNMGISREVFRRTGGFRFDRYAEDIEFSIRMKNEGFQVGLIADAFVYHKRRTNFKQFFQQVSNFGKGRALVGKMYPEEVKITHWFPTVFFFGMVVTLFLPLIHYNLFAMVVIAYGLYFLAVFFDALRVSKSFIVALLSVPSAFLQLTGYGMGFLKEYLSKEGK